MAATIHPLFGKSADAAQHPLLIGLLHHCLDKLDEMVRRMFDSADDALFEMGEKAPNDVERRQYFDTMRVLRIDRNRVARVFLQRMAQGLVSCLGAAAGKPESGGYDLEALAIQPADELDEKIALSKLAAKAEKQHESLLRELEHRLELAEVRGIPVSPHGLSPARICDAFGAATAVLDTGFQIKRVVFKLFDRALTRDLLPVYAAAIEVLDREGIEQRRPSGVTGCGPAQALEAQSPFGLLRLSGADLDALGIADGPAAAALRDLLQVLILRDGLGQLEILTQRLTIAAKLFNEVLAGPMLGDTLRQACEALRDPLYRTALIDPAFFSNAAHPTRKMLFDLVELATAAQTGELSSARFRSSLQVMVGQAEQIASAAPLSGHCGPAMTGAELQVFLAELREQVGVRRNALLSQVRRVIAQELELRTVGRDIPKPVLTLLHLGVGPLMAVRLLRFGRDSKAFHDAESLLEHVIATLNVTAPIEETEARRREHLIKKLTAEFKDIGMSAERSNALLDGLGQVYGALTPSDAELVPIGSLTEFEKAQLLSDFTADVAAHRAEVIEAGSAAAARTDVPWPEISALNLLRQVLTPESWFRVYDAAHNQTRWLKLASFHPDQETVTFTGFDESTRLNLCANRFNHDLIRGLSDPINPTASAREALERLRQTKTANAAKSI